ncbi:MAG: hypothetical protein WA958_04320, partial [Tunicatimonas sp.]
MKERKRRNISIPLLGRYILEMERKKGHYVLRYITAISLLFSIPLFTQARVYYISSSGGDDGAGGTSPES